jgi:ribonuclease HI
MSILSIWTDGSIEGGNPGGHAVGGYIIKGMPCSDDITGTVDLGKSPTMTNNIAEYEAVVAALSKAVNRAYSMDHTPAKVVVHSDSKLVVEQCSDRWQCNNEVLRKLRENIWGLCELFDCPVEFKWIPREENHIADKISRSLYEK